MRGMLRKALAAVARALRASAALVALPVYAMVEGVRTVIGWIRPGRGPLLDEVAEDVVADVEAPAVDEAGRTISEMRYEARRQLPARVKEAARLMTEGMRPTTAMLDPAVEVEAEVLAWLDELSHLQLAAVAKGEVDDVERHLAGTKTLRAPLMIRHRPEPEDELSGRARMVRERGFEAMDAPLSSEEWFRILAAEARESGYEDPDIEGMYEEADRLAARGVSINRRREQLAEAPVPRQYVSDDEDEG